MNENTEILISESIRPYLSEISRQLWSGHAAIMVGSGFSKNARSNGVDKIGFPDWAQLGDLFYEKIHGKKPNHEVKYLNVLKLANEVEAAFGRSSLDKLLRDAIPNLDYEPSELHEKLLQLPWADVFTTNYDTLLERAAISVSSQRYDIVVNKEDLVHSEKPRIIKLHGSFPSSRPFVITEEDYRRYPREFAPFVNTVQQSLLENTLCLIGFSGDDPNFLQWIGWIRDNLGNENSPKIYLIGIIDLTNAQKKLLESRNVIPIDMSSCEDISVQKHYKGLERFFDFLFSKREADNSLGWPYNPAMAHPKPNGSKSEQVSEIIELWKKQRVSYPGWVILPENRRSSLWHFTEDWLDFICATDELPDGTDLQWAFELVWRMNKCLCPIFNDQATFFEYIASKYAWLKKGTESSLLGNIPLQEAKLMWSEIHLSLLRFYREEGMLNRFNALANEVMSFSNVLSIHQNSSFHYERVLFALFTLDIPETKKRLSEWAANDALPFWEAKRAGLLAEIGNTAEAEQILESQLKSVRHKLNLSPVTTDYSQVSNESYIMLLLQYVKGSLHFLSHRPAVFEDLRKEFSERWNHLKQYDCDPWGEVKLFRAFLEHPPVEQVTISEKREFDIGHVTRTRHYSGYDPEALSSYQLLCFSEDAGIPFRIPGSTMLKSAAEGAIRRVSKNSPYWAMATLIRLGDKKPIDYVFNRESMIAMSSEYVDTLSENYLGMLYKAQDDIAIHINFAEGNFGIALAKVIPEILSRLCTKCSLATRHDILNFLISVYSSQYKENYGGIEHLVSRLISSYSLNEQVELLPEILKIPILQNLGTSQRFEFPNPIRYLSISEESLRKCKKPEFPQDKVDSLIAIAKTDGQDGREWAIRALSLLFRLGFLEKELVQAFGEALWSKIDEEGFPVHTGHYRFGLIRLPHPKSINPKQLLKQHILDADFPIQKGKAVPITGGNVTLCKEIMGAHINQIAWSKEDIIVILSKIAIWWDADKSQLIDEKRARPFDDIYEEFKGRFIDMVDVLSRVIIPEVKRLGILDQHQTIERILNELELHRMPSLSLESAILLLIPKRAPSVFEKIATHLTSTDDAVTFEAIRAVYMAKDISKEVIGNNGILRLCGLATQNVRWRHASNLSEIFRLINHILREYPDFLKDNIENDILLGLGSVASASHMALSSTELAIWLQIRLEAANLARLLQIIYFKETRKVPEVINKWESICQSANEFAEIRNAWANEPYLLDR